MHSVLLAEFLHIVDNMHYLKFFYQFQSPQLTNPFEEEKAEARSGISTAGNSPVTEIPMQSGVPGPPTRMKNFVKTTARADALLNALAEPKLHVSTNL